MMNNSKFVKVDFLKQHNDIPKYLQPSLEDEFNYWGTINRINIFIGANNSGKSRFMRSLLKSNNYFLTDNIFIDKIINDAYELCKTVESKYFSNDGEDFPSFKYSFGKVKELEIGLRFDQDLSPDKALNLMFEYFKNLIGGIEPSNDVIVKINKQWFIFLKNNFEEYFEKRDTLFLKNFCLTYYSHIQIIKCYEQLSYHSHEFVKFFDFKKFSYLVKEYIDKIFPLLEKIVHSEIETLSITNNIYIPILRSAIFSYDFDNKKKINSNLFSETIRHIYSIPSNEKKTHYNIFTGLDLYKEIRKARNGKREMRENFEAFEKFLSDNFFQRQTIDIVAEDSDNELEQNIIVHFENEGEDRALHDFGDGIQSLIIIMYPIFTAPKNAWIFIEEPEINLHPGLQRVFIEQIRFNKFLIDKNLTFCLTTHSNHLLSIGLESQEEISIFSFEKIYENNSSKIILQNIKSDPYSVLQLLGVYNSSVFMANCSIWVEGITDRLYIKAFIKAYIESINDNIIYKEDINYAFFEYSGSNVMHYIFSPDFSDESKIKSCFLSNNIFLIADLDTNKENKHNYFIDQENTNFHYEKLEVLEIENLISSKQFVKHLPLVCTGLNKEQLSKVIITESDLYKKKLGKYWTDKKINIPASFMDKSGTISSTYKIKLAQSVSKDIKWEEMSEEAKKLTEKIYNFIKLSNHNTGK